MVPGMREVDKVDGVVLVVAGFWVFLRTMESETQSMYFERHTKLEQSGGDRPHHHGTSARAVFGAGGFGPVVASMSLVPYEVAAPPS